METIYEVTKRTINGVKFGYPLQDAFADLVDALEDNVAITPQAAHDIKLAIMHYAEEITAT